MAHHEPTFDPQELLAQLPFVRGLARELLQRAAAADDVAQEAAVAALESGRANDALHGSLRPWLVGVTRNLARMFRRGERRRETRERVAAVPEALPSSVDESARFEALRRVVVAMERLDAGDRTLLVRRFYDEWPPRRIAAELQIPVNTVRTRLARALERLRRELIDGGGRDGAANYPALLFALVTPPAPLAPLAAPHAPSIGAASTVTTGVLLMTAKLKFVFAVAVIAVTAAGVAWWRRDATRARSSGEAASSDPPAAATADAPATATATRVEVAPTDARPKAPTATSKRRVVTLRGRLVAEGGPIERWTSPLTVTASVERDAGGKLLTPPAPDRLQARIAVAHDGTFTSELELDELAPRIGRLTLVGADPSFTSFKRWFAVPSGAAPRLEWSLEIRVFAAATVRGRVVDEKGRPVADGAVGIFTVADGKAARVAETTVDEKGGFALGVPPPGACFVVASQRRTGQELDWLDATQSTTPQLLPAVAEATIEAAREKDLGDLVLRSGASIRGRVEWYAHGPVAGAIVDTRPIDAKGDERPRTIALGLMTRSVFLPSGAPLNVTTVTDSHGEFELSGLVPGPSRVSVRCLQDGVLVKEQQPAQEVTAPASDLVFRIDGAIVEYAVNCGGEPVEGAVVVIETPTSGWTAARNGRKETGADGRVGSVVAAGIACEYEANAPGYRSATGSFTGPAAGERMTVPIELERLTPTPSLILHVVDEQGAPVTVAGIRLASLPDPTVKTEQKLSVLGGDQVAADGRFVVNDARPGEYQLRVRPGGRFLAGDGCFAAIEQNVTLRAGAAETIEVVAVPCGRLRAAARDAAGRFLPAHFSLRDEAGQPVQAFPIDLDEDADGGPVFRTHEGLATDDLNHIEPPLAPGRYLATFSLTGFATQTVPVEIKPLQAIDLEVVLQPAR